MAGLTRVAAGILDPGVDLAGLFSQGWFPSFADFLVGTVVVAALTALAKAFLTSREAKLIATKQASANAERQANEERRDAERQRAFNEELDSFRKIAAEWRTVAADAQKRFDDLTGAHRLLQTELASLVAERRSWVLERQAFEAQIARLTAKIDAQTQQIERQTALIEKQAAELERLRVLMERHGIADTRAAPAPTAHPASAPVVETPKRSSRRKPAAAGG